MLPAASYCYERSSPIWADYSDRQGYLMTYKSPLKYAKGLTGKVRTVSSVLAALFQRLTSCDYFIIALDYLLRAAEALCI